MSTPAIVQVPVTSLPNPNASNSPQEGTLTKPSCWQTLVNGFWSVLPYAKVAVAIFVLVVNICALVYAFFNNSISAIVFFSAASAASLYLVYLSVLSVQLASFEESNEEFKKSISHLESQNQVLASQVGEFEKENHRLTSSLNSLNQTVDDLQDKNEDLKKTNQSLNVTVGNLQNVENRLTQTTQEQLSQLSELRSALEEVNLNSQDNHQEMSAKIARLDELLHHFQQINQTSETSQSKAEQDLRAQINAALALVVLLQKTLKQFCEWKDGTTWLSGIISAGQQMQHDITKLTEERKSHEEQVNNLKQQIEDLQQIKLRLKESVDHLTYEIGRLQQAGSEIDTGVKNMKRVLSKRHLVPNSQLKDNPSQDITVAMVTVDPEDDKTN